MNIRFISILMTSIMTFLAQSAFATPSQSGSTGLISVPTAETLDSGNLSVGVWGNLLNTSASKAFVLPATITLGIGSFWEIYGTYPNLLFDGEEDSSDRNSADLGMKIRFYGTRSSKFKVAADLLMQRRISQNLSLDGSTDLGSRLIATYKTEDFGIHAFGGYRSRKLVEDDLMYGCALEVAVTPRAKIVAELIGSRPRDINLEGPLEGDIGIQYHVTPYLTLSMAGGVGLNDISPDWRFIFGFSTSTGLGGYIRPVPMLPHEIKQKQDAATLAAVKPIKIIPISPKLVHSPPLTEAVSKIEVPVESDKEEIVIRTYGQIILPPQRTDTRPFVPPPPQDLSSDKEKSDTPPTYGIDVKGEIKDTTKTASVKTDEKLIAYRKFRFPDIVGYFQQGQAELTPDARKLLSEVAEQIRTDKSWAYLRIDGYTDGIGSQKYNTDLSLRRAIEVASYLINREGIEPARLFVRGMGSSKELADNQTDAGRKMNRRFEILFLQRDERP